MQVTFLRLHAYSYALFRQITVLLPFMIAALDERRTRGVDGNSMHRGVPDRAPGMRRFSFFKTDRAERDFDLVMQKDSLTKLSPFGFPGWLMSTTQALVCSGQLLGRGSMHIDPEAFAEAANARAVVRGHPNGISPRGNVNAVRLCHDAFRLSETWPSDGDVQSQAKGYLQPLRYAPSSSLPSR